METTASLEKALSCHLFSKSSEQHQIVLSFRDTHLFKEMCQVLQHVQHIFEVLPTSVPTLPTEVSYRFAKKQRLHQLKVQMQKVHNVIHVPFKEQLAPMFVLLQDTDQQALQLAKVQMMPLLELCARESRDCIVLSGEESPIVFEEGIVSHQSFARLFNLQASHQPNWTLSQYVHQSIASPLKLNSQIVVVHLAQMPLQLSAENAAFLQALKDDFNFGFKAMLSQEDHAQQLQHLVDEVYIIGGIFETD